MSLIKAMVPKKRSWKEIESDDSFIFDITGPITPGSNYRTAYVINMSQNVFVIAFRESNTNNIKAVVATVNGNNVTFGTIYQVGTCRDEQPWTVFPANALAAIDTTRFAIAWKSGNPVCSIVIGTVSGSDISFGSAVTVSNCEAPGVEWTGSHLIFQGKVGGDPKAHLYTLSGNTLTYQNVLTLSTSFRIANCPRRIPGITDRFMSTYCDSSNFGTWEGKVLTISGNSLSAGSQAELGSGYRISGSNVIMFNSELGFAMGKDQVASPAVLYLRKLVVSGSSISVGNLTTILSSPFSGTNGGLDLIDPEDRIFAILYSTSESGTCLQKCSIIQYDEINDVFIELNSFYMIPDNSRYGFENYGGGMAFNADKSSVLITFTNTADGVQQYISVVHVKL